MEHLAMSYWSDDLILMATRCITGNMFLSVRRFREEEKVFRPFFQSISSVSGYFDNLVEAFPSRTELSCIWFLCGQNDLSRTSSHGKKDMCLTL